VHLLVDIGVRTLGRASSASLPIGGSVPKAISLIVVLNPISRGFILVCQFKQRFDNAMVVCDLGHRAVVLSFCPQFGRLQGFRHHSSSCAEPLNERRRKTFARSRYALSVDLQSLWII
jgi:hypothetical protein